MSVKITILNSGMKMIIMRLIIIASLQKDDRYEAIRNIAWLPVLNLLHYFQMPKSELFRLCSKYRQKSFIEHFGLQGSFSLLTCNVEINFE